MKHEYILTSVTLSGEYDDSPTHAMIPRTELYDAARYHRYLAKMREDKLNPLYVAVCNFEAVYVSACPRFTEEFAKKILYVGDDCTLPDIDEDLALVDSYDAFCEYADGTGRAGTECNVLKVGSVSMRYQAYTKHTTMQIETEAIPFEGLDRRPTLHARLVADGSHGEYYADA